MIQNSIRSQHLISPGDHVLVAVSGGSDSMALLDIIAKLSSSLGIRVAAAHLNHGIRPSRETALDLKVIRTVTNAHGIQLVTGKVNVRAEAKKTKESLETAARNARYRFLASVAKKIKATCVATAHTRDDQAETILMRLLRGTGPDGLAGISRKTTYNGLLMIRPLLDISKAELRTYLGERSLVWHEDSTNSDTVHFRNRVRNEILPYLEEQAGPGVSDRLAQLAGLMADEADWLDAVVAKELESEKAGTLRIATLAGKPLALQRRLVRKWLGGVSDDMATVERILAIVGGQNAGKRLHLRGGWIVHASRGHLMLGPDGGRGTIRPTLQILKVGRGVSPRRLVLPGIMPLPALNLEVTTRYSKGILRPKLQRPGKWPAVCSLSAQACQGRKLIIRTWKLGDRISPLGFAGSKKVQDVFTDMHVPKEERNRIPLLVCGKEIVWIPGYHVAKGWEVEDEAAKSLEVRIESGGGIRSVESE